MLIINQGCRSFTRDLFALSVANQRFRSAKTKSRKRPEPPRSPNNFDFSGIYNNLKPSDSTKPLAEGPKGDWLTADTFKEELFPARRHNDHRGNSFRPNPGPAPVHRPYPHRPGGPNRHPAAKHQGPYNSPVHPHHVPKPPVIPADRVVQFFESRVAEWAARPHTVSRLLSYGFGKEEASKLLGKFVKEVQAGKLSDTDGQQFYGLERFAQPHDNSSIDIIFSTTFFWWAAKDENTARLQKEIGVDPDTLDLMKQLVKTTSRVFPADEFHHARTTPRKIIMHVGPTNSGKTHHALRALAAARTGVYAGPLRLLAHEIFLRLNTGQIAPLGADEEAPKNPKGDPKYCRPCNLITGEEKRVVDLNATHSSCTVEMLKFSLRVDVAVIDEIQMIADADRGAAWLSAVVGIWASEVHLCGEETVVPLVQALLKHTHDEIEIRRYERLTPLVVEKQSLKGDFTKIRKGDCIVAFNRSSIFAIKKTVEEVTGMRCAVVYGRLPPEIRSEQAALFNDPDSGYDVIIGSDAIGMGLNLKIKRVIFAATAKYDGTSVRPLAVSAVKQIAGRAGRYGLHKEQTDLGGATTTLFDEDLPHLIHCVGTPYQPLPYVHIGFHLALLAELLSILPAGSPMHTIVSAAKFSARLPAFVRYANDDHLIVACEFIDQEWRNMTNAEKVSLLNAPVPWRDARTLEVIRKILKVQAAGDIIDFKEVIQDTGLLNVLDLLENKMKLEKAGLPGPKVQISQTLLQMEMLHKVMTFYMWMSFRHILLYSDSETVLNLKGKLETVLNWTLDNLSKKLVKEQGLPGLMPMVDKRVLENRPVSPLAAAALEA